MFKFKVETVQPVQVDIKNDDTILEIRQKLLLQQKYQAINMLIQANENLDKKAANLLQASGLIIILTGVLSIPGFIRDNPTNNFAGIGITLAFIIFLAMIGLSIKAFSPASKQLPGSLDDWDEIYNRYVLVDNESCFNQILSDTLKSANILKLVNERKSKLVIIAAYLLFLQVAGLLFIALLTSFLAIV